MPTSRPVITSASVTAGGLQHVRTRRVASGAITRIRRRCRLQNAGPRGLIARWNGTQLEPVAPSSGRPFYARIGHEPDEHLCCRPSRTHRRFDGVTITDMTSPTTADLLFVYALDATHVYAAGTGGVILQYDGSAWTAMTSGTANPLNAIWASGPNDVWAVGVSGTIRHYNGSTWSASTSKTPQSLTGVWGTGPTDVWAVGSTGTILHYNGTSWSLMQQPASLSFFSVWGGGPDDVLAVTEDAMLHYDGTRWVKIDEALAGVRDVRVFDHSHGVLLTLDGRILRWDGEGSTVARATRRIRHRHLGNELAEHLCNHGGRIVALQRRRLGDRRLDAECETIWGTAPTTCSSAGDHAPLQRLDVDDDDVAA